MTRQEIYDCEYISDLRDLISEYELYDYMDILDEDQRVAMMSEDINTCSISWQALRDNLMDADDSYYYYRFNQNERAWHFEGLVESDIDSLKEELIDLLDGDDYLFHNEEDTEDIDDDFSDWETTIFKSSQEYIAEFTLPEEDITTIYTQKVNDTSEHMPSITDLY